MYIEYCLAAAGELSKLLPVRIIADGNGDLCCAAEPGVALKLFKSGLKVIGRPAS